jgi:hypothetical protein
LPAMFVPFLKTKKRPLRASDATVEIGFVVQRTPLSCSPVLRWTGIFYSGIAVDPLPTMSKSRATLFSLVGAYVPGCARFIAVHHARK